MFSLFEIKKNGLRRTQFYVYVKVKYATEADYIKCQEKLKSGELSPNKETIIK